MRFATPSIAASITTAANAGAHQVVVRIGRDNAMDPRPTMGPERPGISELASPLTPWRLQPVRYCASASKRSTSCRRSGRG